MHSNFFRSITVLAKVPWAYYQDAIRSHAAFMVIDFHMYLAKEEHSYVFVYLNYIVNIFVLHKEPDESCEREGDFPPNSPCIYGKWLKTKLNIHQVF